jgi:hypothetical protein
VSIPFEKPAVIGEALIDLAPDIAAAILQTVEFGWEIARKHHDLASDAKEIVITERLRDGMREALKARKLPWRRSMVVLPGTESRSTEFPVPDGRTDIPILFIEIFLKLGQHDPHAIIECKRVAAGDANLIREYVKEGMDRFCSRKYGAAHSRGFMTGYVLAGAPNVIVEQINAFLKKSKRTPEQLSLNGQAFWLSQHPRTNFTSIELNHAFLPVGSCVA